MMVTMETGEETILSISEFQTGIQPTSSISPLRCSDHWVTRTPGELSRLTGFFFKRSVPLPLRNIFTVGGNTLNRLTQCRTQSKSPGVKTRPQYLPMVVWQHLLLPLGLTPVFLPVECFLYRGALSVHLCCLRNDLQCRNWDVAGAAGVVVGGYCTQSASRESKILRLGWCWGAIVHSVQCEKGNYFRATWRQMSLQREKPQETFAQLGDLHMSTKRGVCPKTAEKADRALTLMTLQATGYRLLKIKVWTIYWITGSRHWMQFRSRQGILALKDNTQKLY